MALGSARSLILWAAAVLAAACPLELAHADERALAASDAAPTVEGIVLLPDGKPAAGAHVSLGGHAPRAFGSKRGWCVHSQFAITDARGRFRYAEHDGFSFGGELRLSLWARTVGGGLAAVYDVKRSGSYSLVLGPAKRLEIETARVRSAPPATGTADLFFLQVRTAIGTLQTHMAITAGVPLAFEGVPPGMFVVEVQSWCGSGAPCAGAIARGRIDADRAAAVRRVPLAIAPYGVAEGVAVEPSTRAPIATAPITCDDGPCAWDVDGFWPAVHTTPDGRYRIAGLAPGTHALRFGDRAPVVVDVAPAVVDLAPGAPARGPAIAK